ncbi:MAG: PKD domain-containing protein [Flavobacteriaceae bacterium]
MFKKTALFCALCVAPLGWAQEESIQDSLQRVATIRFDGQQDGNTYIFGPETPPLQQIAGAPKAYYSYYWEFGDGTYSKEKSPSHIYVSKGEYTVRLWATNHYDTGKPPTALPKKVSIDSTSEHLDDQATMNGDFTLQRNREPMPEDEMVLIMSYKNTRDHTTRGKLYLFYNEQKYKANNFDIIDTRTHHGERQIPSSTFAQTHPKEQYDNTLLASRNDDVSLLRPQPQDSTERINLPVTLEESQAAYRDWDVLEFNGMEPNEERNIFFTLRTTPEMLKDTSAIVSVRGVYIPDSDYDNHKVKDMEMEIVTSHDPNKMSSNGTLMNYRLVRLKTLKYKIKFQNNGEVPARTIRLETDIPDMLDKSTLEIMDMYPKCRICPKKEVIYSCLDTTFTKTQAIFTFKNIYLPGSEQKNVMEYDSTKGFVRYKIKFGKDFHKKKTKSRTAIIFDKNDPILTNYSTTRFLPGISIGIKSGYKLYPNLEQSNSYFMGATISPYKSYRWYWQVEWENDIHTYDAKTTVTDRLVNVGPQGLPQLQRTTTNSSYRNVDWEIPILVRYNVNDHIGIGMGIQGSLSISERRRDDILIETFENETDSFLIDSANSSMEINSSFSNFRSGALFEATLGFARIGPSLGARYVLGSKKDFNHWQFYAIWKL